MQYCDSNMHHVGFNSFLSLWSHVRGCGKEVMASDLESEVSYTVYHCGLWASPRNLTLLICKMGTIILLLGRDRGWSKKSP